MKRKIRSICTWVSTALFAVFVGLYIYAWVVDPNLYSYPHPSFFHVSLGNARMAVEKYDGGQVVFFNAPIPNGTTSLSPNDKQTGWGSYGIEYRLININDAANKTAWWTLRISLWYPIIIFGILPATFVVKKLRNRKSASTKEATVEK